ncbi:MAG: hypothetical protein WDN06_11115 [Asticcacaulis sp.]
MTNLNRTAEWPRLKNSFILPVEDQPGKIVITNSIEATAVIMMGLQAIGAVITVIALIWMIAAHDVMSYIFFVICLGVLLRTGVTLYWPLYLTVAHKVEFNSERIEFYGLFANHMGGLAREAMQQIAVEKTKSEKHAVTYHHFLADSGYMPAFPSRREQDALIRNNLLMAAFGQPLHLDTMPEMTVANDVRPASSAPQINDLKPVE